MANHPAKPLGLFSIVKINSVSRIPQSSDAGPVRQFQSYPGVPLSLSLCEVMPTPKQTAQLMEPGASMQVRESLRHSGMAPEGLDGPTVR